jgi:hypothetical protein
MGDVLPAGYWHLGAVVAAVALCAANVGAGAQIGLAAGGEQTFEAQTAPSAPEPAAPAAEPGPHEAESAPPDSAGDPRAAEPAPPEQRPDAQSAQAGPPAAAAEPPLAAAAAPQEQAGIGNGDVQAMAEAEFSDETIIAVIAANTVAFDLSPRALVALKRAGVSERVIAAMIDAVEAQNRPAEPEPSRAELAETQASIEYARLTQMIEQLAQQQEEALKARRAPEPPASNASAAPRVWLIRQDERVEIAPTIAQVAVTGGGGRRGERMKSLRGLANHALAFANPAISGIATTLGSLFRPDEQSTAVWALAAAQSSRVLDFSPVFEIEFAYIPGVDPDRYRPQIVQLVPTQDNYRLVAAAETDGANAGALPRGPIIEESVATESTRLGRGQYRVAPKTPLDPGEYALVLRPIPEPVRSRRHDREASLGELLGGSTSQILYLTWEFSVAR